MRASDSLPGGRGGKAGVSGNGKVGRGTSTVDLPSGGVAGVRGVVEMGVSVCGGGGVVAVALGLAV